MRYPIWRILRITDKIIWRYRTASPFWLTESTVCFFQEYSLYTTLEATYRPNRRFLPSYSEFYYPCVFTPTFRPYFLSDGQSIVHWWKEASRNERESDWLTKATVCFHTYSCFYCVFVTYTNPNNDLILMYNVESRIF